MLLFMVLVYSYNFNLVKHVMEYKKINVYHVKAIFIGY